jgi:hypothetical protein
MEGTPPDYGRKWNAQQHCTNDFHSNLSATAWSRSITQASVSKPSVRSSVEIHLAAKLGIHEDNVADGQHHAKAPPDQANG